MNQNIGTESKSIKNSEEAKDAQKYKDKRDMSKTV